MNLRNMRQEVENIVDDSAFDPDTIDYYINHIIKRASDEVYIPSLKRMGTVDTVLSQAYTNISLIDSISFDGRLGTVITGSSVKANVFTDLEEMLETYPDLTQVGAVTHVALEGNTLWYRKIPESAETLTLTYYTPPDELSDDTDVPSDFPEIVHRSLFVNGAAWLIWDQKEEGLEDKRNSINYYFHSFDPNNRNSGINQ